MTQSDFYAECLDPNGAYKYFKDNEWLTSDSGKFVKINNPTSNEAEYLVQGMAWMKNGDVLGNSRSHVACEPL